MFVSALLRGGAMTDERAKERERQDEARGRLCYVLLYVLHRDDSAPWWEATPFWGSKSPHESHGAQPFSLSLSLGLHLTLALYLPFLSLWDSACLREPLSFLCLFLRCHMYLSRSTIGYMGCAGEQWSAFVTVFTFIHSSCHMLFLSPTVSLRRLQLLGVLQPHCWVSSLQ